MSTGSACSVSFATRAPGGCPRDRPPRSGDRGEAAPDVSPKRAAGAGEAMLVWLDGRGGTLAIDLVTDPRVAHVPLAPEDTGPVARVALGEGSWMARGPDEAATLIVRLRPAREAFALGDGEWRFALD